MMCMIGGSESVGKDSFPQNREFLVNGGIVHLIGL